MNITGNKNICSNNLSNKQQLNTLNVRQLTIQTINVLNYLSSISGNIININNDLTSISGNINTINNEITTVNTDISLLQNYYNGLGLYITEVTDLESRAYAISYDISNSITTINSQLNTNYMDLGYKDTLRQINSGNIIYGSYPNYDNGLNIFGKATGILKKKIFLWDDVSIMGNLNVSGSTYVSTLSGVYVATIFGISSVNAISYGTNPSVSIDNSIANNPKLTFNIPAGKPADNPIFTISSVILTSSPYVTLSGVYPSQYFSYGLPRPNFYIGPTSYSNI